jgi:phage terminase Nu1 subunit (DNA packaging protein)
VPAGTGTGGAGLGRYFKEAFFFRWNVLLFLGGVAAAILSPWPDALLPLVAAGELTYLLGLTSIPRFRSAIDAKAHHEARGGMSSQAAPPPIQRSVAEIVVSLPLEARRRFELLHKRCQEMRAIAHGVRGRAGAGGNAPGEEIRTPALDRLLWVFLRLLLSQDALQRFLKTTSEAEISARLEGLRKSHEAAQSGGDERIIRSLQDSVAVTELRLDNYRKAKKNAEFVAIELDRIEGKIQALTEMAVNRQDPDFLSSQVDSVAESMRQTEKAISELQHITGLSEELEEPPPILESNLKGVLRSEA